MKLFGLERIAGGLSLATSSGRQTLIALPAERTQAARVLGERLLDMLDDPAEPHAEQRPTPPSEGGSELADGLLAVGEGLDATRTAWRALRLLTRGRR
jgi:hypothetical protein